MRIQYWDIEKDSRYGQYAQDNPLGGGELLKKVSFYGNPYYESLFID